MCYSIESSLKTTAISLFAILYMINSNEPYFIWIGISLIGWCGMQFAELLLWLTNPINGCSEMNKLITLTLIPLVLILQPLSPLFGSLYVIPWNKSTEFRKHFILLYSIIIILGVGYCHFYKPYKLCTTVTPNRHLYWNTSKYMPTNTLSVIITYFLWAFLIILPLLLFWNKHFLLLALFIITPLFGFIYGLLFTDSKASIWCYYTSYTSITSIILLFLKQMNIFDIMKL